AAISAGVVGVSLSGAGVAAAFALRVAADDTRTQELLFNPATKAAVPLSLGPDGEQVFLLLFGTGVRGFEQQVTATVGDLEIALLGAVAQGEFAGLDQVNIGPLPRALIGRGEVQIVVTVDGKVANVVTVTIQ
ncbi:MAG: hypothetical protein GY953_37730, partial [bacterium]|nr:hypothetical protein [bacterium]